MSNFENSVHLILGATGGIGSALARRLKTQGAQLILAARDEAKVNALATELSAIPYVVNAANFSEVEAAANRAIETFGKLDGAANCVGSLLLKPAHITSEIEWANIIEANLTSAFATVRAATKAMKTGGSIVLVSSAAARTGLANHDAIAAAKAGVIGLTLSAAASYAARNIRVNCVAPGLVETPMTTRITSNEASLKGSTAMHALGRIGLPDDVASAIEFLLQPKNNWITGQVIGVDGGLGSVRAR